MRQPSGWLVMLAITAVLALLLACVLVFPRLLHPPLSSAELAGVASADKRIELQQAQAKLQNDARATLLQGIAGLLLVAGAVATWRQVQISREGQITERFSRAIDQLGSNKEDVRLGGIYTLERITKDSLEDRRTVQAVLGAYVRGHSPWLVGSPKGPQHPTPTVDRQLPWLRYRAPDVQTAVVVLGRTPRRQDELQLNLSRVDLRGAVLNHARLSNTLFRHTNLARAQMVEARLENADLEDADLREADLRRARLTGANLRKAHLQGADLRGADLRGAHHEDSDLTGACADARTTWPDDLDADRRRKAGIVEEGVETSAGTS